MNALSQVVHCQPCIVEPSIALVPAAGDEEALSAERVRDQLLQDYKEEEIDEVWQLLQTFKQDATEDTLEFPQKQGNRQRRLSHAVAEAMGLFHFSIGAKKSERYVVVTKADTGVVNGSNCSAPPSKRAKTGE